MFSPVCTLVLLYVEVGEILVPLWTGEHGQLYLYRQGEIHVMLVNNLEVFFKKKTKINFSLHFGSGEKLSILQLAVHRNHLLIEGTAAICWSLNAEEGGVRLNSFYRIPSGISAWTNITIV